jgi:crossover junction endodeoxyribonuclease RusA
MYFDFLIPKRPVSLQTRNRNNLQAWRKYVQTEAAKTWQGEPYSGTDIQLTLVYLYDRDPVDIDNIVKPIQDALIGLVYDDDLLVTDVESHRRLLTGTFDLTRCPDALIEGIVLSIECVYVRVCAPRSLEDYL